MCNQVFNLFLPFDPVASRLEPLIDQTYSTVEPVHLPRYQSFPFNTEILYKKHPLELITGEKSSQLPDTPTLMASGMEENNGFGSDNSVDTISSNTKLIDNGKIIEIFSNSFIFFSILCQISSVFTLFTTHWSISCVFSTSKKAFENILLMKHYNALEIK